jgi:hypothetical protein
MSLPPLPLRIVISRRSKSTSFTPYVMHSIKRLPVRHMSFAINACTACISANTEVTSLAVNMVGRRGARVGRATHPSNADRLAAPVYIRTAAHNACLCAASATRRSLQR